MVVSGVMVLLCIFAITPNNYETYTIHLVQVFDVDDNIQGNG